MKSSSLTLIVIIFGRGFNPVENVMLQYYRNTINVPSPSRAVKHEQTLFQIKCSNKSLCQQLLSPPAVLYAALHLELIASCMLSCVVMVKLFHGHKSNICQERAFIVFPLR